MSTEVIVALIAVLTVLVGTPLATFLTLTFNKRKTAAESEDKEADAEAKRMAAVFSGVEPLHRIINTLDQRVHDMTERITVLQVKLDAADEKVGMLERREREYLHFQAEVATYVQLVTAQLISVGVDVPPAPTAPPPRAERTRKDDR